MISGVLSVRRAACRLIRHPAELAAPSSLPSCGGGSGRACRRRQGRHRQHVRLSLFVESTSYLIVFFFYNKSANCTFSYGLSVKQTGPRSSSSGCCSTGDEDNNDSGLGSGELFPSFFFNLGGMEGADQGRQAG